MASTFTERLGAIPRRIPAPLQVRARGDLALLSQQGVRSFGALTSLAQDQLCTVELRAIACWALGWLGNPRAGKPLIRVMMKRQTDRSVVWEAAKSVVLLDSKKAGARLVTGPLGASNPEARAAAAWALGQLRVRTAVPRLLELMANRREPARIRGNAAEALGLIRDKRAVGPLIEALEDPIPEVRFWSAYSLGELRAEEALLKLKQVAKLDDAVVPGWWAVKKEARRAIQQIRKTSRPLSAKS